MLFINSIHLIISVAFSSSVTPCFFAISFIRYTACFLYILHIFCQMTSVFICKHLMYFYFSTFCQHLNNHLSVIGQMHAHRITALTFESALPLLFCTPRLQSPVRSSDVHQTDPLPTDNGPPHFQTREHHFPYKWY